MFGLLFCRDSRSKQQHNGQCCERGCAGGWWERLGSTRWWGHGRRFAALFTSQFITCFCVCTLNPTRFAQKHNYVWICWDSRNKCFKIILFSFMYNKENHMQRLANKEIISLTNFAFFVLNRRLVANLCVVRKGICLNKYNYNKSLPLSFSEGKLMFIVLANCFFSSWNGAAICICSRNFITCLGNLNKKHYS